ncbi:hypothetical protein, partial [Paenibacillus sp. FSL H7-0918]|uniref:hypothetical protein n=1 Tax=Paenibacillus sp. FSL H7-0918 TaxID=2921442 RepID=UPI0030F6BA21
RVVTFNCISYNYFFTHHATIRYSCIWCNYFLGFFASKQHLEILVVQNTTKIRRFTISYGIVAQNAVTSQIPAKLLLPIEDNPPKQVTAQQATTNQKNQAAILH